MRIKIFISLFVTFLISGAIFLTSVSADDTVVRTNTHRNLKSQPAVKQGLSTALREKLIAILDKIADDKKEAMFTKILGKLETLVTKITASDMDSTKKSNILAQLEEIRTIIQGKLDVFSETATTTSTGDNKLTFTSTQLATLKSDLTQLYLTYQDKDKNAEPTKSEFGKGLDSIFSKDLGVDDVTTKNFGIFLYPEIASIMADIKKGEGSSSNTSTKSDVTVSLTSTASPDVEGVTDLSIKPGDKFYVIWKSTNADEAYLAFSLAKCPDPSLNREIPATKVPVESYHSEKADSAIVGCTMVVTVTAKNLKSGEQAIATNTITVK